MAGWMEPKGSLHRLGCLKFGRLADFETSILSTFAPYFESLKPCARSLCNALFPSENMSKSAGVNLTLASPITHRDMIKIFASTLHSLPDDQMSIPREPRGRKRGLDSSQTSDLANMHLTGTPQRQAA
jgi:hypothetical protein